MISIRTEQFNLSTEDFNFLCDFIYQQAGIVITASKKDMLYRRLTRIIRERKLASFEEYCQLLKSEPEQETEYFINAITTNLTSFFRENHHFDYLREHEIPQILEQGKLTKNRRLRIWSSASSTGEEPYSIAITLHQCMANLLSTWDVKILATDIDSKVVATGKAGIYESRKLDDVDVAIKQQYFNKGKGENSHLVKVKNHIQQMITFKQLNLLHHWPMKGLFDVIFCRNVIIYFDKKTQMELFQRFYDQLKPGGLLILGHSESLGSFQPYFLNVGRTIYRKPDGCQVRKDVLS